MKFLQFDPGFGFQHSSDYEIINRIYEERNAHLKDAMIREVHLLKRRVYLEEYHDIVKDKAAQILHAYSGGVSQTIQELTSYPYYLRNLKILDLSYNVAELDLSGIQYLPRLVQLNLTQTQLKGLSALGGHPSLEYLTLSKNRNLEDLNPLKYIPQLRLLDCHGLESSQLKGLPNLNRLTHLSLNFCAISRLPNISKLKKLQTISLQDTNVFCLDQLKSLPNLRDVHIKNCIYLDRDYIKRISEDLPYIYFWY